ncbi:MAG: OmpA family protein, partial [Bacteroidota bacterium]
PNLEMILEVVQLIEGLDVDQKTQLRENYNVRSASVGMLQRQLVNQVKRETRDLDMEAFWQLYERVDRMPWSEDARERLNLVWNDRKETLMRQAEPELRNGSLKQLRIWEAQWGEKDWGDSYIPGQFRDLTLGLIRGIVQDASATYEELSEVYNFHFDEEILRNPEAASNMAGRLLNRFLYEHGFTELGQFVADNPQHWVALDCYVGNLVDLLKNGQLHRLTHFLQDHPFSIIDGLTLNYINESGSELLEIPGSDVEALRKWLEDYSISQAVRVDVDTSDEIFYGLLDVLERRAQRPWVGYLFVDAAQMYLRTEQWLKLDQLIAKGREVFNYGQPIDCGVEFLIYQEKQNWLQSVQEILTMPRFDRMAEAVTVASLPMVDEYSPVVSADGKRLYFARRTGNATSYDIVYSTSLGDTAWSLPRSMPVFSTSRNEVPLSLNASENELLLFLEGRLAISRKVHGVWQQAKSLEGTIAEQTWHGPATLSNDGKYLIVELAASQWMRSTVTDTDLFLAERKGVGIYDLIGPLSNLNTYFRESGPLLSYDNRTLYFSTDGRDGLGGKDVYMVQRLGSGWHEWSEPVNFGASINSFFDDENLKLATAAAGVSGFLNVRKSNVTLTGDIFQVELPELVRPKPMRVVKIPVQIPDYISTEGLQISVTDSDGITFSNGVLQDSGYIVLVPEDMNELEVVVEPDDPSIIPVEFSVELMEDTIRAPIVPINSIDSVISGLERIRLLQAYAVNQADFSPDENVQQQLRQILDLVKDQPDKHIVIHAYSDDIGTEEYNLMLCRQRAEAVGEFLQQLGLDEEKIQLVSHGKSDFIASNLTESGRARNRRVEVGIE